MTDSVSTPAFTADPMAWFRARQRQVLIAGGLVLGVGAVGGLLWWSQARKEAYAGNLLEQARNAADGPNGSAVSAGMLQKIIDQYSGTDASQEAVLTLAQIRIINGQNQLAVAALTDFVAHGVRAKYAAPTHGLLGGALEGTGRYAEAGENFMEASRAADLDALKAQYLVDAARAFGLANDTTKQLVALRAVVKDFSKTALVNEATVRLSELTKGAEPAATH